jgi:hypothetical protein
MKQVFTNIREFIWELGSDVDFLLILHQSTPKFAGGGTTTILD